MDDIDVENKLHDEAFVEWNRSMRASLSSRSSPNGCSELLNRHGLCHAELFRIPPRRLSAGAPFVFLHLSKCAGTSMLAQLEPMGWTYFTLGTPHVELSSEAVPVVATKCGAGVSAKCCYWRERLHNYNETGRRVKLLTQEPANEQQWVDGHRLMRAVDPGFDGLRDFCAEDLAYVTVLRPPIARAHSHMCEIGVSFAMWQGPAKRPGAVSRQLRDNYYVRSFGGAAAWNAPEGSLSRHHLHAAARTLARFDVVMTVATLSTDAPIQMRRVGLADFRWRHVFSRSRTDNLERAAKEATLRTSGRASCEVPPNDLQLRRLVAASAWDAVLYEFARELASRRTAAYGVELRRR